MGFRLTPRDHSVFELFAQSAQHLVDGARELTSVLGADPSERAAIAQRIHEIEHAADEATHDLIRQVNGSFVTPFDREDIHSLASRLDTCLDHMDAAADLIVLYRLDGLPRGIAEQVETLDEDGRPHRRVDAPAAHDARAQRLLDRDQPPREPGRPGLPPPARRPLQRRVGRRPPRAQAQGGHRRARGRRRRVRGTSRTRSRTSPSRAPDAGGRGGHRPRHRPGDGLQLHQRLP